jgi:uncharacterized RDD family membrane protein YckC
MATCPSCETTNVEGTKFCVSCGATLAPDPGAWRAGTAELNDQPFGASSAPIGSGYSSSPYNTPAPGALYNQTGGTPATLPGGLQYAVWADRVIAALIDAGLIMGVVIALYVVITIISTIIGGIGMGLGGAVGGEEGAGVGSLLGSSLCCVTFFMLPLVSLGLGLYNKVHLVSKRGASIGQGMMNLKVVTEQGSLVPVGTLVLRLLVQVGFGLIPFLPLLSILWPLWDPQRQALHDKAVGTFVVKNG